MSAPSLPEAYASVKTDDKRINAMIEDSCQWGNTPDGGMNRLTLNDDDKTVRDWFIEETKKYGCSHKIDEMGNTFAIYPGQNPSIPPIGIGSHLDTQPKGGKYDGILGVISGLEVLAALHTHKITPYAPLAIINWTNEEGARFPPAMLASGVWGGAFTLNYGHSRQDLNNPSVTLKDELKRIGYLGEVKCSAEANPLTAHFEVHIEQGPILDKAEEAVGIVAGVQSMRWFSISLVGAEAHTGTTPMDSRCDALLGAAHMIVKTNELSTSSEASEKQTRMTIAVINSQPQSINTIAGHVELKLDIRSPFDSDVEAAESACRSEFSKIAETHGLEMNFERIWESKAIKFDPTMVSCVKASAAEIGCTRELTSGAGHDSVYTSRQCPTAMIFVRCKDGVSHNPKEYSRPEDCAAGAKTLLGAYLRYDGFVRSQHEK